MGEEKLDYGVNEFKVAMKSFNINIVEDTYSEV
jgi:hypothetical protein